MKTKSVKKKLMTTAENLWKEVCRLRDGEKCAYCGVGKEAVLQVDHAFSRTNSALFFDVRNGTTLCKSCHFKKSKNLQNFPRLIDRIVISREGAEWFGEAEAVAMSLKPYVWNVIELEQLIIKLKEQRAEILGNR